MRCLEITFTELHEEKDIFDKKYISAFPEHLIISHNLEKRKIVFPRGWRFAETERMFDFQFGCYYEGSMSKNKVADVNLVEEYYKEKDFEPDNNLQLVALRMQWESKASIDDLVLKYRRTKAIVAKRSREKNILRTIDGRKKFFPAFYYELVFRLTDNTRMEFFQELKRKIADENKYTVLVDVAGVFPRQLANFDR